MTKLSWERDPALPSIKYVNENEQTNISMMVKDIIENLPVTHFRDYVEFEDVVHKVLENLWPRYTEYFQPITLPPFLRHIRNRVRENAEITFATGPN